MHNKISKREQNSVVPAGCWYWQFIPRQDLNATRILKVVRSLYVDTTICWSLEQSRTRVLENILKLTLRSRGISYQCFVNHGVNVLRFYITLVELWWLTESRVDYLYYKLGRIKWDLFLVNIKSNRVIRARGEMFDSTIKQSKHIGISYKFRQLDQTPI